MILCRELSRRSFRDRQVQQEPRPKLSRRPPVEIPATRGPRPTSQNGEGPSNKTAPGNMTALPSIFNGVQRPRSGPAPPPTPMAPPTREAVSPKPRPAQRTRGQSGTEQGKSIIVHIGGSWQERAASRSCMPRRLGRAQTTSLCFAIAQQTGARPGQGCGVGATQATGTATAPPCPGALLS